MTPTPGPTLDQAPPNWGAYARTMQEHADEHNRWKQALAAQDGPKREERPMVVGYTQEEIDAFWGWLEA